MSIVVDSRPIKSGCNYNAVGNPIVYELIRKDHIVNQVNSGGGGMPQLQINGVDLTAYYEVGNRIYFESTAGYYDGVWDITASTFSGGNTLLTLYNGGTLYAHPVGGYINNLSKRTDYAMSIQVLNANSEAFVPLIEYQPDTTGRVQVDVAHIIKTQLTPDWNLPATSEAMATTFKFKISTAEFYDDAYHGYTDDTEWIIGVLAVLQLFNNVLTFDFNADGGNMLAFVPDNTDAKWLTKFNRPSLWRGYPFTVSFLWPATIANLKRRVVQKDITGAVLSTTDTALPATADVMVRITAGVVNANAKTLEITLLDASDDSAVSSTLKVDVKEPCSNPVHLFWNNSLGGDSYWQFEYNQELEVGFKDKTKASRLTLFAHHLLIDEWMALNELLVPDDAYPVNITNLGVDNETIQTHYRDGQQIYMVNAAGDTKIGVISIPAGMKTTTRKLRHMLEIEIELPTTFTV
jgi:hypothetical protein